MAPRILPVLLASLAPCMFSQVPITVKAGDPAPPLTWTKIVASDPASGTAENFFGYTTVLLFLRPVSHNEQTVSAWNELVGQFAGKPVNFVWIANEKEESLVPFLKEHPVRGWMLLDPQEASYRAYGVEGADEVLIDPHGIISGFTQWTSSQDQLKAVLDGRAVVIRGEPTEEQLDAFFEGKAVRLEAQPSRTPPLPQKPDLPPSDEVHISLSGEQGTVSSTAPDYWMRRGFDLRAILSSIFDTGAIRIELPQALDNGTRYDFVFVPRQPEDEETVNRRVREAIEKYFRVTIASEIRSMDVYVITADKGKTPPRKSETEALGGGFLSTSRSFEIPEAFRLPEGAARTRKAFEEATRRAMESPEYRQFMAMAQLVGMTAISTSMDDFRRGLEEGLQRPVVDETELMGFYDFQVQGEAQTTEGFLAMLCDQLGLLVTPAPRSVEMIVVRPSQ
jgi:uncharacterized protein (TIGR03435 family)